MLKVGTIAEFAKGLKRALVTFEYNSKLDLPTKLVVFPYNSQFYAMEAVCPHSGGPLHLGPIELVDIEELGNECKPSLVCPWHHYKFTLHDGKSVDDEIFKVQKYPVAVEDEWVLLDYPAEAILKSIAFFDLPLDEVPKSTELPVEITKPLDYDDFKDYSLVDWAVMILNTPDPSRKVELTLECSNRWNNVSIKTIGQSENVPNRPARHTKLEFIDRTKMKKVGKGGNLQSRIAILHALANVEQWAIDLAWDIIARFSTSEYTSSDSSIFSMQSQRQFFSDFVKVAADEAKHYTFLVQRLSALGSEFGSLPVHDGLWDSAVLTFGSLEERLAIVHMVHEARGLDVNPSTIMKFNRVGDSESVEKLTIIHNDEITHVAAGQRWFSFICEKTGVDKYKRFHDIIKTKFFGPLRPPFNEEDRLKAGLDAEYYLPLASINK